MPMVTLSKRSRNVNSTKASVGFFLRPVSTQATGIMPWRPFLSLVHININSLTIQGNNPLLNITGDRGSHVCQSNSQHWQPYSTLQAPGHGTCDQASVALVSRRVEAQTRVRRKLEEARNYPGSVYDIDNVAQVATNILSLVEA